MRTRRQIALSGILTASIAYSVWAGAAPQSANAQRDDTKGPSSSIKSDRDVTSEEQAAAPAAEDTARDYSTRRHNSLRASTGLLHLVAADSGAAGTFRLTLLTSYYSGSGFLCPSGACGPAPSSAGAEDSASRMGMDLGLSATVLPFLEVGAGMHSHALSDDYGKAPLFQVLGDSYFNVKGFLPRRADNIFSFGGLAELRLLNGSGSIGTKSANLALAALGTVDLSNRSNAEQRIPLRFHGNVGYLLDNSSSIAKDTEASRGTQITRIERFGLGINRVDSLFMGLGAEYVSPVFQPFAEWTVDVATNRQGYKCPAKRVAPGDVCMEGTSGMQATPSRLTLGTRLTPGFGGLNATLALDVGTSGTSTFVDERAPEIPWNVYLGVGWAVDTVTPPPPVPIKSEAPPRIVKVPPPPEYHIVGTVIDQDTNQPVAHAAIEFLGRDLTGLISRGNGAFETGNLAPGEYKFQITADGYKDGSCSATVLAESSTAKKPDSASGSESKPDSASGSESKPDSASGSESSKPVQVTEVKCSLKPAPPVGSVQGVLTSTESGAPIPGAQVRVHDKRDRVLELQCDSTGTFHAENVPAGSVRIVAWAAGFLPNIIDTEVKKKVEQHASLSLSPMPKKPNVKVTPTELKLVTPIRFAASSPELAATSTPVVSEIAAVLGQHRELAGIEIQVYTDEETGAVYSKRLSEERGQQLRSQLLLLGVEANRLSVKAFGNEKPLAPGATTEAAREKNRRVVLRILQN
jgi:outer membrane protein OmpA-like peptidoglycan-associated protein